MFSFEREKELKNKFNSKTNYDKPVICYYPDWRAKYEEKTEEKYYVYFTALVKFFEDIIERVGGSLYLLGPEDDFIKI